MDLLEFLSIYVTLNTEYTIFRGEGSIADSFYIYIGDTRSDLKVAVRYLVEFQCFLQMYMAMNWISCTFFVSEDSNLSLFLAE